MKLGFASDHRGFKLKNELINYLSKKGYSIIDYGTNSDISCDYPDFAYKLGKGIVNHEVDFGIAICGSGIGISIALNKIKGIYCAKVSDEEEALHTRSDNDTNAIAFGEKMSFEKAIRIIETFITTPFSNLDKHIKRLNKLKDIESGKYHA